MGSLEVICGCMWAGKSEELLRRVKRCILSGTKVLLFKPDIDTRYSEDSVVTHDGNSLKCNTVPRRITPKDIEEFGEADVYAFDECTLFEGSFLDVVRHLIHKGKRVIVAGLDLNFRGEPFGIMPALLAYADKIDKLTAICPKCGKEATRTQRIFNGQPITNGKEVVVGGAGTYEPRCKDCFVWEEPKILR
ncbi:MAG: thymidine kinase [Bdellovibrionaceae bacterium]|nr:thymidine kinase [Pseudobdellovibrionaceae bacterium]